MDLSIKQDRVKPGWNIVYIEGLYVIILQKIIVFLWESILFW